MQKFVKGGGLPDENTITITVRNYCVFWDKKSTKPGQIQSEDLFLKITSFWRQKIYKTKTDTKL